MGKHNQRDGAVGQPVRHRIVVVHHQGAVLVRAIGILPVRLGKLDSSYLEGMWTSNWYWWIEWKQHNGKNQTYSNKPHHTDGSSLSLLLHDFVSFQVLQSNVIRTATAIKVVNASHDYSLTRLS